MSSAPAAAAIGSALAGLPALRDVIARHRLAADRRLGQHFLLDLNLTRRIVRAAGAVTDGTVIEIGPGPGGLTRSLLEAGACVIAVEKDRRCVEALGPLMAAAGGALTVIEADAMTIDVRTLAPPPLRIVANLPYNVATPLLIGWLRDASDFAGLTLMFQKEVADRLAARPGTAAYGRLSVIAQWRCDVCTVFAVDARAFTPPPKVASAVVTLTPRPAPLAKAEWGALERVTAAAFGQRRKMLRGSLRALGLDPAAVGIAPTRRAEELDVEEFCRLARLLAASAVTT